MDAELLADGSKRISLSRDQFEAINKALRAFYQKTKCGAVLLVDSSGLMVAQAGTMDTNVKILLSTLAAGNYAATNEMARLLQQDQGFKVHFLEGDKHSLFVTGVNGNFFLAVVFGESVTFGMVRILCGKMTEQLRELLAMVVEGETVEIVQREVESEDFREELSSRLDAVLFQKG